MVFEGHYRHEGNDVGLVPANVSILGTFETDKLITQLLCI